MPIALHPVGEFGSDGQGIRSTTREPDDRHVVNTQCVGNRSQVVGKPSNLVIEMRTRRADSGSVDAHKPDLVLQGEATRFVWNLSTSARSAVQPDDRATAGISEFSEADAPPIG